MFTTEIGQLFLLWPGRFERDRCVGRLYAGEEESLHRDGIRYLRTLLPSFHEDDLASSLKRFLLERRALPQWYGAILEERGIAIDFFDAQPRISRGRFTDWWWLTRFFDPDALVTYRLATQGQADRVDRLRCWGTFPVAADAELDRTLSRGLADAHVHLTGCEPVPLLWQRLIDGDIRMEQVQRYSVTELERIADDAEAFRQRLLEQASIETAIAGREWLRRSMNEDAEWMRNQQPSTDSLVPALIEERRLLAWSWRSVLKGSVDAEWRLDQYLFAKNNFLSRHHLYAIVNPGLRTFRRYFDGTKEKVGHRSRRLQILETERRLRFATESPYLTNLELRISPFDSIAEYVEFFRTWEVVARALPRHRQRKPEIRFVVHFIRSAGSDLLEEVSFEKLRRKVDRQSAVLHLFRQKVPELARYIVGIDVANLERDCPPAVFTPYLRLLRGQAEELRSNDCGALCNYFWLRLLERDEADHPVDLPRLGLTYHAGEDFYHPIEGMRNMDDAIHGAAMVPGDRLGHGLAAGWDLDSFYGLRGRGLTLPQGVLLDDLVWLWRRLDDEGAAYRRESHELLEEIADLGRAIYGHSVPPALLYRLQRRWRHRHVPAPLGLGGNTIAVFYDEETLWHMELFDRGCRKLKDKPVPLPEFFIKNPRALTAVQEGFLRDLARKRIVVEFNPTSNWALGHFPDLRSHPFHRYVEVQGSGSLVSFNTDDPGVLGSRIENEFALMLDALAVRSSVSGQEWSESLELLENVRRVGIESIFRGANAEPYKDRGKRN